MNACRRADRVHGHLKPSLAASDALLLPDDFDEQPGQQLSAAGPDGFVFTRAADSGAHALSPAQRTFFEVNGYLVVRDNFPLEELEDYKRHFARMCAGNLAFAPGTQVVRDIGFIKSGRREATAATINKITSIERDGVLMRYARHPSVTRYLRAFLGDFGAKTVPFTPMLVNKPPDPGGGSSRHPLHQDLYYMPLRPANRIVCAWTAMGDCDERNGCLFVQPGSHIGPLMAHEAPTQGVVNAGFVGVRGAANEGDNAFAPLGANGSGGGRSGSGSGGAEQERELTEKEAAAEEAAEEEAEAAAAGGGGGGGGGSVTLPTLAPPTGGGGEGGGGDEGGGGGGGSLLHLLPMRAGDTVFFHPLLLHGSGRNRSAGCRQAISAHFAATDCEFFDTSGDPVQRARAERLQQTAGRRRSGGAGTPDAGTPGPQPNTEPANTELPRSSQPARSEAAVPEGTTEGRAEGGSHVALYRRRLREAGGANREPVYGAECDAPGCI